MFHAAWSTASTPRRGRILLMRKLGVVALLAVAGACAPKTIPAPVVFSEPKFPEFVEPVVPPELASTVAAVSHSRGWRFLQAGDLKSAEREFSLALTSSGAFYPAEAALGYVAMARKDVKAALPHHQRQHSRFADQRCCQLKIVKVGAQVGRAVFAQFVSSKFCHGPQPIGGHRH